MERRGFFAKGAACRGDLDGAGERRVGYARQARAAVVEASPAAFGPKAHAQPQADHVLHHGGAVAFERHARHEPGMRARFVAYRAKRAASGEADERLVGEVGQRQGFLRGALGGHGDADAFEETASAGVRALCAHGADPQVPTSGGGFLRHHETCVGMRQAVGRDGVHRQPRGPHFTVREGVEVQQVDVVVAIQELVIKMDSNRQ